MTSSLVGSEMCIRDSLNSVLHALRFDYRQSSTTKRGGHYIIMGTKDRRVICLLYTSDAADDM
eukprot:6772827-Prorocentrum_lima.AAC.1